MAKETGKAMVNLFVPKVSGEDESIFIGLNGKSYIIPRGKSVEVPEDVAKIYYESEKCAERAEEFKQQQQQIMNVVQGAPGK